jgi:hypothetical protein
MREMIGMAYVSNRTVHFSYESRHIKSISNRTLSLTVWFIVWLSGHALHFSAEMLAGVTWQEGISEWQRVGPIHSCQSSPLQQCTSATYICSASWRSNFRNTCAKPRRSSAHARLYLRYQYLLFEGELSGKTRRTLCLDTCVVHVKRRLTSYPARWMRASVLE